MSKLKSLELLTVGAGLFYYTHEVSTLSSRSFLGQTPGWCVANFALSLFLELKIKIKDSDVYRSRDSGLWCCVILPAILNITSPTNWPCFQLVVPCSLMMYVGRTHQSAPVYAGIVGLAAYTLLQWMMLHQQEGIVLACCALYCLLLWHVPAWFPRSFTFGEVAMVTQLFIYFLYTALGCCMYNKVDDTIQPVDQLTGIVFLGVILMMLLIKLTTRSDHPMAGLLVSVLVTGAGFCLPAAVYVVGWPELCQTLVNLLWFKTAMVLFSWWLLCTVLSIFLVTKYGSQPNTPHTIADCSGEAVGSLYDKADTASQGDADAYSRESKQISDYSSVKYTDKNTPDKLSKTSKSETYFKQHDNACPSANKARTQSGKAENQTGVQCEPHVEHQTMENRAPAYVRKMFHLVMLCVYLPGLMFHSELLYLASSVAAGVLVVIEAIRVCRVPVVSAVLNQHLSMFLDQQDRGDLILTPLYLLIGCSLPLWLHPRTSAKEGSALPLYTGLITIGVGDSMASLLGRRFGKHKWPGSPKSIEGTAAAVIAQVLTVIVLYLCGVPDSTPRLSLVFVMCLSACLEAFSTQIDNLVVPSFTYMLLLAQSLRS